MPENPEIPKIKYSKGEAIVAMCQWVVEHKELFNADSIVTEDFKNKVDANLKRIAARLSVEDNDTLLAMIMVQLILTNLKDFLAGIYNEPKYKAIEVLMDLLGLDAIDGV